MVKEFAAVNNSMQIRRLLKVLGQDFAMSKNPNSKKGGLIGLAAMAVGLGKVCTFCLVFFILKYHMLFELLMCLTCKIV